MLPGRPADERRWHIDVAWRLRPPRLGRRHRVLRASVPDDAPISAMDWPSRLSATRWPCRRRAAAGWTSVTWPRAVRA